MVVTSGSVYHLTAAGDLAQARGAEAMRDDLAGHNKELEETVGCLSAEYAFIQSVYYL
jgi:hypothetical protein